jgi:hypothetical protein
MAKGDKSRLDAGPGETAPDPDVRAFVDWFVDWWLRRGQRLTAEAGETNPKPPTRSRRRRRRTRWDEHGRLVLIDDRVANGASHELSR